MMTRYRPGNFQEIPVGIKNLLIINILIYALQFVMERQGYGSQVNDLFALHHIESPLFRPHQLISHMFMHGSLSHLFGNMLSLWLFGTKLEQVWGPKRVIIFYLVCGLGAAALHLGALAYEYHSFLANVNIFRLNPSPGNFVDLYHDQFQGVIYGYNEQAKVIADNWIVNPSEGYIYKESAEQIIAMHESMLNNMATLGASGAVFGFIAGAAYLFPNSELPIPIFFFYVKLKWVAAILTVMELRLAFENSAGDTVAHWAHLGGALFGFLMVYYWNKTNRKTFY